MSAEKPIGYYVNVSVNRKPYYVMPIKAEHDIVSMLNQRWKIKGMYYLYFKGRIVYIGISQENVYGRILSHFKDKEFDAYTIWHASELTSDDGDEVVHEETMKMILEHELPIIKKFKPKYNSLNAHIVKLKNKLQPSNY